MIGETAELGASLADSVLDELVMQMEISAEFTCAFLNIQNNKICRMNELVPDAELSRLIRSGSLHLVPSLSSQDWYLWMVDFAGTVTDPFLRAELDAALNGISAIWRFRNILYRETELSLQWETFKNSRLRGLATEWLDSLRSAG